MAESSVERLKKEREALLALIRANEKASPIKPKAEKEKPQPAKQTRTQSDVLAGLGEGILRELEQEARACTRKLSEDEEGGPHQHADAEPSKKTVHFAEQSQSNADAISAGHDTSESRGQHRPYSAGLEQSSQSEGRKSSKSSGADSNKLADLNNLLKGAGTFNIKEEDENEFEVFMRRLQEKRG